jgi:aspartate/tyrosine/aromatic aminotransferase
MRDRIAKMRAQFVALLHDGSAPRDFSFLKGQHGMFALTGLTRRQVDQLRDEHAIYLVGSGRMNVAGLNEANLRRVTECIVKTLEAS